MSSLTKLYSNPVIWRRFVIFLHIAKGNLSLMDDGLRGLVWAGGRIEEYLARFLQSIFEDPANFDVCIERIHNFSVAG